MHGLMIVAFGALIMLLDFALIAVLITVLPKSLAESMVIGWSLVHIIAGIVFYKKGGRHLSAGTWFIGSSEFGLLFNVLKISLLALTVTLLGLFALPIKLAPILAALVMNKIGKSVPAPSRQEPVAETEMQI